MHGESAYTAPLIEDCDLNASSKLVGSCEVRRRLYPIRSDFDEAIDFHKYEFSLLLHFTPGQRCQVTARKKHISSALSPDFPPFARVTVRVSESHIFPSTHQRKQNKNSAYPAGPTIATISNYANLPFDLPLDSTTIELKPKNHWREAKTTGYYTH